MRCFPNLQLEVLSPVSVSGFFIYHVIEMGREGKGGRQGRSEKEWAKVRKPKHHGYSSVYKSMDHCLSRDAAAAWAKKGSREEPGEGREGSAASGMEEHRAMRARDAAPRA